jgi:hypothetical protein
MATVALSNALSKQTSTNVALQPCRGIEAIAQVEAYALPDVQNC